VPALPPASTSQQSPWEEAGRTAGKEPISLLAGGRKRARRAGSLAAEFPRNHHSKSLDEAEGHRCLGKAKNCCKLGPVSQQHSSCGSAGPTLGRYLPYQRIPALVCCLKAIRSNQSRWLRDCAGTPSSANPRSLPTPQEK